MGWSSGSQIMGATISALQNHVPDDVARQKIYVALIGAFEEQDWDTQDECKGEDPAYDAALQELYPDDD